MPTRVLDPEPEFTFDGVSSKTAGETGRPAATPVSARRTTIALMTVLALVVVGVGLHIYWPPGVTHPPPAVPPPPASTPELPNRSEPAIQHPVERIQGFAEAEAARAQLALPPLDDTDAVAKDAIATIVNDDDYVRLLAPQGLIRRIVATIDNLPRQKLATRILPIKPVPGVLSTAGVGRDMSVAGDNADRYAAYVKAAEAIDAGRLVGFYLRLYPLFQQAYVELGYPGGHFNDRLIAVIDHLLAAPEPKPPVHVSQPKIMFEFAEPDMEALSAGQKILVRTGIGNELRLKAKLREIRRALVTDAANR